MEIDVILKIAGIGIITAIVNIILKKSDKDEIATFVTITALVIVLLIVVDMVGGLFETVKNIFGLS
ncbi:MAG TPA: stage III sporulation protein AC [Candidatus Faecicola pullistercoris]|nr:stage III sporulation protein AC [Candidatus Faecicola pullistercoris]